MIRLENWSIVDLEPTEVYKAPELRAKGLHGNVYGHPAHRDGVEITTSRILEKGNKTITTSSGNVYSFGQPAQEYERLYPNAFQRLFGEPDEQKTL